MAFREVAVIEVREVLRAWLSGVGLRRVAEQAGVDRKTARRYVEAAREAGLDRQGDAGQLTDELIGQVVDKVRPVRPGGHGQAWEVLSGYQELISGWVKDDKLTVVKIGILLERQGVGVQYRTLHRFCVERCGFGGTSSTVRVADGTPGVEVQIDFARMGLLFDPVSGRRRAVHALIFTAVYSRHMFVWLSFSQTLAVVIAGSEAAWRFFGGVFGVVIPDNMSPIVADANAVNPRLTVGWLDYAQHAGTVTDTARVRHPKDKPRVAYCISSGRFVRCSGSGWSGVLGAAADLRPVGRVVGVGRAVEELSLVVIAGAGDNSCSAPGFDGVVADAVGGGGLGEGEHAGVAEALAAAA
jgi:transposase